MKKNIIPDSSKILSTYENNYAVVPGGGGGMPPFSMQPAMPPTGMQPGMQPAMPPMGMQPGMQPAMPPMGMEPRVPGPPVLGPNYIQGYLRRFIGQYVRIDFIVGTGMFIDRDGILREVGIDFVQMEEVQTGNILIGDLYSIKFVTVYSSAPSIPAY
ncbi:hypothetical protein GC105_06240 [Alkalibaculum sp. M08DMB]|uniref:Uncharacterized protein n=1 Tax=Alkalibaculum sporogenes TaxID=2655001 RepID=A0A6A7K8G7_9FIRM|nr:hypothetical protein [Alkalibaculum sporogenes]MPW25383.1 hypothetical protein [Alkalibaculum sporogenes]